jgi:pilus assembly protein CpaC
MTSDRVKSRSKIAICVAAALFAILPASSAGAADSVDPLRTGRASDPSTKTLQLGVGKSVIVDLPEEAGEIYVGEPKIANAIVRSARRVYISGVANGQTSIFALARDGRKIATIEGSVGRDVGELSALLNVAIPGNDIHVRTVADKIILTGSVASAEEAQKAIDIASGFVDDAAAPTQSGAGSVSISVGSNGAAPNGSDGSAASGAHGKVINSLTMRPRPGQPESDGGRNPARDRLQAFERQGVAHTLAEPTVTAVSGESAKFLAGGTIPILNNVQCNPVCQYGFIQQPYGVTLNFTPVVLSEGRIQLRIATEVTDVDYATQVTYSGISIPGFRTRNNTTTVELPSGGSIASAGLISTQTQQAVNGFPALMNVPILGALFRSRVRPDQNFQDASDPQTWLLGRVNRIYSTSESLQPMLGYAGKIGFITQ